MSGGVKGDVLEVLPVLSLSVAVSVGVTMIVRVSVGVAMMGTVSVRVIGHVEMVRVSAEESQLAT